ncbi:hypothetical protein Tsubulata_034297 [Turnera subulata]|uniref:Uncharacterized protein n=1 Tax=Turnera subulata TaxID=218843 RepID=A0A9Q0FKE3_9ROSI|nr:hypothetical protein Tsubulata_034297 [Turnera subulata]
MRGGSAAVSIARLIRPLSGQSPVAVHLLCCSRAALNNNHALPVSLPSDNATSLLLPFSSSHRGVHVRSRAARVAAALASHAPSDFEDGGSGSLSESDSESKKSRNQKKREAQRAVNWGMQLASFSTPQIKRILRVASLKSDVFNALMLVKRLGADVREGKRRQFNYIGKLLRDVQPELMEALIEATKDGNWGRVQGITGGDIPEQIEYDEEEEVSREHIGIATRWFDGLVSKDVEITNEVYAIRSVSFDRQELRKLVRQVHTVEERTAVAEENGQKVDAALTAAKRSLTRFLLGLAKETAGESYTISL